MAVSLCFYLSEEILCFSCSINVRKRTEGKNRDPVWRNLLRTSFFLSLFDVGENKLSRVALSVGAHSASCITGSVSEGGRIERVRLKYRVVQLCFTQDMEVF